MRAAVVYEHGPLENIILEKDYADPEPGSGWVRLRVRACSLNYHDIFSRQGMPGVKLSLPLIIGSDIAGEVDALGEGVEGWSVGQRVLVDPLPTLETRGMNGEAFDGGRAEYCLAHAGQLVSIPDSVPFEVAASIPLAYATAHRMMVTRGRVQAGETVLILGASGGVGTACVLIAKMLGASVIACASTEGKLDRLTGLGADHVIDYVEQDMREAVWEIVGKPRVFGVGGVDVVINSTGGGTWVDSTRCMKVGARLVTCGATAGFEEKIDVRYVWTFEHNLMGSNGWRREDITTLLGYAEEKTLLPVIDRVVPLAEIREAERAMQDREIFGKTVIIP
jgi:alcohol dehydrogenase